MYVYTGSALSLFTYLLNPLNTVISKCNLIDFEARDVVFVKLSREGSMAGMM